MRSVFVPVSCSCVTVSSTTARAIAGSHLFLEVYPVHRATKPLPGLHLVGLAQVPSAAVLQMAETWRNILVVWKPDSCTRVQHLFNIDIDSPTDGLNLTDCAMKCISSHLVARATCSRGNTPPQTCNAPQARLVSVGAVVVRILNGVTRSLVAERHR